MAADESPPALDHDANSAEDDLFGDDDEPQANQKERRLDDSVLDSGDDLDRNDQAEDALEDEGFEGGRPMRILDADLPRIPYPQADEYYLLNMPAFLGVKAEHFNPETYTVPTISHDGDPERQTSAYSTAMSSLFWRRDPADIRRMQSTARLIRWSDGSLTMQLATKPTEQYPINVTAMRQDFDPRRRPGAPIDGPKPQYDPAKDSLTFLAAAASGADGIDLQLIHSLDASLKILPSQNTASATATTNGTTGKSGAHTVKTRTLDDSTARLKASMATISTLTSDPLARGVGKEFIDPVLAREQAEKFERERLAAARKRENAEDRQYNRKQAVLGSRGLGRTAGAGGGLTLDDLEGDGLTPGDRTKSRPKKRKSGPGARRGRNGSIYSNSEDEGGVRGRTKEDEYDMDDGFVAGSDEEEEEGDADSLLDDDEEEEEEDRRERSKPKKGRERQSTPKRGRDTDEDEDAEGEPDDDLVGTRGSPQQAKKRTRVLDSDDEE